MIAVLIATRREADPLLTRLEAETVPARPFDTWRFAAGGGGLIVVSGMGCAAARQATAYALDQPGVCRIVNTGICGSLRGHDPGALFGVTEVMDGQPDQTDGPASGIRVPAGPWADLARARLVTVLEPVFDVARRQRLAARADLVDMEGFAIARACRERRVPCHLVKGVSDGADAAGKEALHRNLPLVCEALAGAVAAGLLALPDAPKPVAGRRGLADKLMRLVRVEHTILSIPMLVAGALLGTGGGRLPRASALGLIVVAGVGARALGMAMNRILDRDLDALNPRTAARELPSGQLSVRAAYAVAAVGLGLYLLACAGLGPLVLLLSPLPAVLLMSYSLLKRFTCLCHFGIGLCLAAAPAAAFVAVTQRLTPSPDLLLLTAFAFCWMSGFDIVYAMQDADSDRRTGVRSIPAAFGRVTAERISAALHLLAMAALAALWWRMDAGLTAALAGGVAAAAFVVAHLPGVPLATRFFPVSAVAGIAGAMVPMLEGFP